LGVAAVLATCGLSRAANDEDGFTENIKRGMTRSRVEKILGADPNETERNELYRTRWAQLDEYPFEDDWSVVVPFSLFTKPGDESSEAAFRGQRVVGRPWVMRHMVIKLADAKEPCFRVRLPEEADQFLKKPDELAQVMAGDIFRNGGEVALVTYSHESGESLGNPLFELDAVAFFSRHHGRWGLRSFFSKKKMFAMCGSAEFLTLAELSGDRVPEVTLRSGGERAAPSTVFKYDLGKDRLVVANPEIVNPERNDRRVFSLENDGGGSLTARRYVWRGNRLVLISQTASQVGR
jgi:hypothetical protein